MSKKDPRTLNSKTLTIAAIVLMVLALLFMATPLLNRDTGTGITSRTGFTGPGGAFPGQGMTGTQDDPGFVIQAPGSGTAPDQGVTMPGGTAPDFPTRQFQGTGRSGLLPIGLMNGTTGMIVYGVALLVALVAAVGMFMTKRWGKILGILMGVIYTLMALFSLLPALLMGAILRVRSPVTTGLAIAQLVLAIAVIVLASIPGKKIIPAPVVDEVPASPAASG